MQTKANPAQVLIRSTCPVLPGSFAANGAWAADISRLTFPEYFRVWVPSPGKLTTLFMHMHAVHGAPRTNWRDGHHSTTIQLVCEHL